MVDDTRGLEEDDRLFFEELDVNFLECAEGDDKVCLNILCCM